MFYLYHYPLPSQKSVSTSSGSIGSSSWELRLLLLIPCTPLMNSENYLNHPTFGLLYRICLVEESQEIFTTLYAQRIFFLVTHSPNGISFQPITRNDARLMLDNRLRVLRRNGQNLEYRELQKISQQNFPL